MPQFYAYLWLREDRTPYYAGKGCGRRAYKRDDHRVRPPSLDRIIVFPRPNEADAFKLEIALIRFFGRKDIGTGCLRNMTDGGENPPSSKGIPKSLHFRRLISERSRGNAWGLGNRSWSGKTHTPEQKAKISAAGRGRTHNLETRAKLSAVNTGRPRSPEYRAKISASLVGKHASIEIKAKMSASHRARHDAEFIKTAAWG